MSYALALTKMPYIHGPKDGDKRVARGRTEYFALAGSPVVHRYSLMFGAMTYDGELSAAPATHDVQPLLIGVER